MAFLYMPNGVNTSAWAPEGTGRDFKLSAHAAAPRDFKDHIIIPQNLWNEAAKDGDGHYVKESSILTSTRISKTLGEDLNSHGVSMDQVAAQKVGGQTPFPSLELGISPEATGVDLAVGYTRVYGCHIAWSSPTTPLAREINPRSVYERLFAPPRRREIRGNRMRCCSTAYSAKPRTCAPRSGRRTAAALTNTCRSCVRSKSAPSGQHVTGRNAWKPRVPLNSVAGRRTPRRITPSTSA